MNSYRRLLEVLWPMHRTLVSEDMDRAVDMIREFARKELNVPEDWITCHEFPSGAEASTWIVPKKYTLHEYSLEEITPSGTRMIVQPSDCPLSVAEYSIPVDETLSFEELRPHLFFSERRPEAIPFVFKFFYRPNWGFCIPKATFDTLDPVASYRVRIDAEFSEGALKCLEIVLPGDSDNSLLIMSNICHPWQVNDSITGAINALMLVERFHAKPRRHTLRFGFWPETIGAQAYFSKFIDQKERFKGALFTEMLGTPGEYALQLSRQETASPDCAARFVLESRGIPHRTGRYTTVLRNDERISNGVNLDIPTISLSRYPYPEYHTSDDTPSLVDMQNIIEANDLCEEILDILDAACRLVPGELFGQPFLTRYGLFHDSPLAGDDPKCNLNKITEDVISYSDGRTSLFDIAYRFGYRMEDVEFVAHGLVENGLFSRDI